MAYSIYHPAASLLSVEGEDIPIHECTMSHGDHGVWFTCKTIIRSIEHHYNLQAFKVKMSGIEIGWLICVGCDCTPLISPQDYLVMKLHLTDPYSVASTAYTHAIHPYLEENKIFEWERVVWTDREAAVPYSDWLEENHAQERAQEVRRAYKSKGTDLIVWNAGELYQQFSDPETRLRRLHENYGGVHPG